MFLKKLLNIKMFEYKNYIFFKYCEMLKLHLNN